MFGPSRASPVQEGTGAPTRLVPPRNPPPKDPIAPARRGESSGRWTSRADPDRRAGLVPPGDALPGVCPIEGRQGPTADHRSYPPPRMRLSCGCRLHPHRSCHVGVTRRFAGAPAPAQPMRGGPGDTGNQNQNREDRPSVETDRSGTRANCRPTRRRRPLVRKPSSAPKLRANPPSSSKTTTRRTKFSSSRTLHGGSQGEAEENDLAGGRGAGA